jgi:hypothetical protein
VTGAPNGVALRDAIDTELTEAARQAIKTNKATMTAYYVRMRRAFRELTGEPGTIPANDTIIERCRAMVAKASRDCPIVSRQGVGGLSRAADMWALSVYATRLLRDMGQSVGNRDLTWLRDLEGKL